MEKEIIMKEQLKSKIIKEFSEVGMEANFNTFKYYALTEVGNEIVAYGICSTDNGPHFFSFRYDGKSIADFMARENYESAKLFYYELMYEAVGF